jgi:hypothetical protein
MISELQVVRLSLAIYNYVTCYAKLINQFQCFRLLSYITSIHFLRLYFLSSTSEDHHNFKHFQIVSLLTISSFNISSHIWSASSFGFT